VGQGPWGSLLAMRPAGTGQSPRLRRLAVSSSGLVASRIFPITSREPPPHGEASAWAPWIAVSAAFSSGLTAGRASPSRRCRSILWISGKLDHGQHTPDLRAWCGYDHFVVVAGLDRLRCPVCGPTEDGGWRLSGPVQGIVAGTHRVRPARVPDLVRSVALSHPKRS
jgi:hypothetical protein